GRGGGGGGGGGVWGGGGGGGAGGGARRIGVAQGGGWLRRRVFGGDRGDPARTARAVAGRLDPRHAARRGAARAPDLRWPRRVRQHDLRRLADDTGAAPDVRAAAAGGHAHGAGLDPAPRLRLERRARPSSGGERSAGAAALPIAGRVSVSGKRPTRILIVDDSAVIRRLLTNALSADPEIEVVAEAADVFTANELIAKHRPDVVTL